MPTDSLAAFADALRKTHLLTPPQLADVTDELPTRFPEARMLAAELIRRAWLTPFQANKLLQNRGDELVLGSYVLLERIGEGGMGQVFKARNWKLNTVVALKLVRKEKLDNPDAVRRFHHEIRAAAQLEHPNIVRALDADEVNGAHLLVMEYVQGVDLAKLVKQGGPLPVDKACDCARQAALGLQHAFERGLVHRDIKPPNLLLTPAGVVKILDMGLARLGHAAEASEASSTMTQEGMVMGTLDYIAPEQAMDSHSVDIRADLYSLGCTLYFLLTGKVPFPGGTAMEKLMRRQSMEPEPIERLRPEISPATAAMVRKLMARRADDRYRTPAEAVAALAHVADPPTLVTPPAVTRTLDFRPADGAIVSTQPKPKAERRGLLFVGLGGGALLFLAAVVALLIWWVRPKAQAPTLPADNSEAKVTWKPGPPVGMLSGLIARPARLPGIRRWQMETALPRNWIVSVSWSPDGKLIAYGDIGGRVRLIDVESRRLVQLLPGHTGGVNGMAWSPDGEWLATAGQDKVVRLWRPDGTRGPVLTGHPSGVMCVAWSKDGKQLASGGDVGDPAVRLWSVNGAPGPVLPHETLVGCVAFSPDGHTLASTDTEKRLVRLWDTTKGTPITTLGPASQQVTCLAWSPDGKHLASNGGDFAKEHVAGWIWDVVQKKQVVHLPSIGEQGMNWIGWNAENGLASMSPNCVVALHDTQSGEIIVRTEPCTWYSPSHSANWTTDGRHIADTAGRIFEVNTRRREITPSGLQPHQDGLHVVAWSPDGKRLASGHWGGALRFWGDDGSPGLVVQGHSDYVSAVAWSPNGERLASVGPDGIVRLWNADGSAGPVLRGHEGGVNAIAWSRDGKRLVSASGDKTVRLWDADGTPGPVLRGKQASLACVAWSPDNQRVAASGGGEIIQLWDANGTPQPGMPVSGWTSCLAWSPDGERLASAGTDPNVRLWNKDGSPGPVLSGHEAQVESVAWSPDGKRLATASHDATVRLWNADGAPELVLRGHEGAILSVAWGPDGRLASAGLDSTLRVWDGNGETIWTAVLLPGGNAAVFSAAGELLHGDPESVENYLVYMVEEAGGRIVYLQPSEFRKRLAAAEKAGGR